MRFRRLSSEELNELEKEFVNFLVSNTVTAEDWKRIKVSEPEHAEELIDLFSDIVMEKVVSKIEFVEHRESDSLMIFKCGKEEISMVGLSVNEGVDLDLKADDLSEQIQTNPALVADGSVSVMKLTKAYSGNREEEVYEIIEKGGLITNDRLFTVLSQL